MQFFTFINSNSEATKATHLASQLTEKTTDVDGQSG